MSKVEQLEGDEEVLLQHALERLCGSAWEFVEAQGGRP